MDMYPKYTSPFGYQTGAGGIDTYGVNHNNFSLRDEIEYQFARQKRENQLMQQYNNQGITENYPQYTTNFWDNNADNNYGFGMTNITDNIANLPQTTPMIQATIMPQTQQNQSQNILSEAYNTYKDNGLLGLGMQYAEPSVKKAMKAADWLKTIPISDINKHQYVSCIGAKGGPLAAAETLAGGIYKEFDDYKKKSNNPQLLKQYGGRLGIISDNLKDFGNDVVGIWKGLLSSNSYGCEELLPERYRNKKY